VSPTTYVFDSKDKFNITAEQASSGFTIKLVGEYPDGKKYGLVVLTFDAISNGLSGGAIAGIVIGSIAGASLAGATTY
jgi:hypothetical protein